MCEIGCAYCSKITFKWRKLSLCSFCRFTCLSCCLILRLQAKMSLLNFNNEWNHQRGRQWLSSTKLMNSGALAGAQWRGFSFSPRRDTPPHLWKKKALRATKRFPSDKMFTMIFQVKRRERSFFFFLRQGEKKNSLLATSNVKNAFRPVKYEKHFLCDKTRKNVFLAPKYENRCSLPQALRKGSPVEKEKTFSHFSHRFVFFFGWVFDLIRLFS